MSKAKKRQRAQARQRRQDQRSQRHDVAAGFSSQSRRPAPAALRSPDPQAVERAAIASFERLDGFAGLRNGLRKIAAEREDWAGIPMPLDGERLIIEPTYPNAAVLATIGPKPEAEDTSGAVMRNTFWSVRWRCMILVWDEPERIGVDEGGCYQYRRKICWGKIPGVHHFGMDLSTLNCCDAWGIEQESRAVRLLGELLSHRQFKQYMLTGMFMETSKRSGIHYVFRRLKPTVAVNRSEPLRILCTLCLHAIGYYQGTWAGAMCPTDDVISHLMLMRGDEPLFWRRSNQHPPFRPEAGL